MTTIIVVRSFGVTIREVDPNKPSDTGVNPRTLALFNSGSKEIRPLFTFPLPKEVLAPGTQIIAATATFRNTDVNIPITTTIGVRRIIEKWNVDKVTWNNRPAVDSTSANLTKATSPRKGTWKVDILDLMVEAQQTGKFYGLEVRKVNGSAPHPIRLQNNGSLTASIQITYSTGPAKPTQLTPSSGQTVSASKPTLRITSAPLGEPVAHMQVQVDPDADGALPSWDSGWFVASSSAPSLDLATAASTPVPPGSPAVPAFPTTYAPGDVSYWRTRVRDADGTTTEWSAWAQFTYQPLGTLTLLSPDEAPDNTVTDPTPPVVWSLTGQTQAAYRVWFTDPTKAPGLDVIWDSGVVQSTDTTVSPGKEVATVVGKTYVVHLRVWDIHDRVVTGGITDHVYAEREFTFQLSAGVEPVDAMDVIDMAPLPFAKVVFTRSEAPDSFQIVRDGVSLGVFPPSDLIISGDDYEFVDELADPRREHTWIVRAIVNNQTSAINPSATGIINPAGIWLSQPEEDRYMPFITEASQSVGLSEDGATFSPLRSQYSLRITSSLRGWSGTITGEILATELSGDSTGSSLRDLFLEMREDAGSPMILTLLDLAIKVVPFNMTVAPTPTIGKNEDYVYAASFEFIEVP